MSNRRSCLLLALALVVALTVAPGCGRASDGLPVDVPASKAQLWRLAEDYLRKDDGRDAQRLALVRSLLDEGGLDISGRTGTQLLQLAVSASPAGAARQPRWLARQLALAQLAVAHGACAQGVLLGACNDCNAEPAFLDLMLGADADINASRPGTPALFDRIIETDDLDAAERLIRLGADPGFGTGCRVAPAVKQGQGCGWAMSER